MTIRIHTLDKQKPHPSWKGWRNFLNKRCEVRRKEDGVIFYGVTNCNYILFPCGLLIQNFGYHGNVLMNRIKEKGKETIKQEMIKNYEEIQAILKRMKSLSKKT